jgi:hypothetical protein
MAKQACARCRFSKPENQKPETIFGNVKADVLADKDPKFVHGNFCSVIRSSSWGD